MIHQIFIDQDGQGGFHAAGAWQIVLPNKLVALGAHYPVCLGNGFEQRELVVGQENDESLVLHAVPVDDVVYGLCCLLFVFNVLALLVQQVQNVLNVGGDAVEAGVDGVEHFFRIVPAGQLPFLTVVRNHVGSWWKRCRYRCKWHPFLVAECGKKHS